MIVITPTCCGRLASLACGVDQAHLPYFRRHFFDFGFGPRQVHTRLSSWPTCVYLLSVAKLCKKCSILGDRFFLLRLLTFWPNLSWSVEHATWRCEGLPHRVALKPGDPEWGSSMACCRRCGYTSLTRRGHGMLV